MKIILSEDVPDLGAMGELVDVKPGYARNFLLPRNLAVPATTKNLRRLEHEKRVIQQRVAKAQAEAETLKGRIESLSVTIAKQVGEEDKIFGSVTSKEIEESMREEGIRVDRKCILLDEPIRALGVYPITVRLHRDVSAKLKIWVVAK